MKKKLIEVSLPLEEINKASAKEKSIRHGHPSTLHLWWARRPLAACRAVLFASLVDDPSSHPDRFPTEKDQERERQRLHDIIKELIKWENSNNPTVLEAARREILASTDGNPPPVLDPFCGGGSIPLEAQRLGLKAHGSDLNPVAVLITKALIEIPPKFADQPPINPGARKKLAMAGSWTGARGLADDVRWYGEWMRDHAEKRIGHLYPKVQLSAANGGGEATVIAWIWARTVRCPNPKCGAQMPLVRSFALCTKLGKHAWLEPVLNQRNMSVRFEVRSGAIAKEEEKRILTGSCTLNSKGKKAKAEFRCLVCGVGPVKGGYIDDEANNARMGQQPIAIVIEGARGRTYIDFSDQIQLDSVIAADKIVHQPEIRQKLPNQPCRGTFASNAQGRLYGFKTFSDYFTPRQLIALATFTDLIAEARERILADGASTDYANAVTTYLAFAVDKMVDTNTCLCSWQVDPPRLRATFGRQGLSMTWDFAEANIFGDAAGDYQRCVGSLAEVLERLPNAPEPGQAYQADARTVRNHLALVCTDPPYYDNISYADLSDFF